MIVATTDNRVNEAPESEDKAPETPEKKRRSYKRVMKSHHPMASVIAVVNKPREYVNHSYSDFSNVPADSDHVVPAKIENMTFAQKVHDILSKEEYAKWMCWLPHGRAFKIHVPVAFEKQICEKYFGHKRYSSFLRQLNNHGFKHLTSGPDRNSFYHECMLRGLPHLCKFMPEPRDARRLIPDPENEPNFYLISKAHPLPDDKLQQKQVVLPVATSLAPMAHPRLASEVAWFSKQLPPSKRHAPAFAFMRTSPAAMISPTHSATIQSLIRSGLGSPPAIPNIAGSGMAIPINSPNSAMTALDGSFLGMQIKRQQLRALQRARALEALSQSRTFQFLRQDGTTR